MDRAPAFVRMQIVAGKQSASAGAFGPKYAVKGNNINDYKE